jgi:hypothetical protein
MKHLVREHMHEHREISSQLDKCAEKLVGASVNVLDILRRDSVIEPVRRAISFCPICQR